MDVIDSHKFTFENKRGDAYLNGSVVEYTCISGYLSETNMATCNEDGIWTALQCIRGIFFCF